MGHIEVTSQEVSELLQECNDNIGASDLHPNDRVKQYAANHRQAALCKALLEIARAIKNASSFSHPD